MSGAKLTMCCVIVCLMKLSLETSAGDIDESKKNGSRFLIDQDFKRSLNRQAQSIEQITGLKVNHNNRQLILKLSRSGESINDRVMQRKKEPTIMQRIGSFLMMIPVSIQLLQLPMAIASVKASLLKSLLIAKVAIFILFLRVLFTPRPREKIVIVKSPPLNQFHEHYYHPFRDPEDDKPGWLGKGPAWMSSY